jgi:hypothetical protein
MKIRHFIVAAAVVTTCTALAQPQTSVQVERGPGGKSTVTGTSTVVATVVAIDPATRTVKLKDNSGHVEDLKASEAVRNFDQLKIGDVVTTRHQIAISMSLAKTAGSRSSSERQILQPAASGTKPGGSISREVTMVADVVAVDVPGQSLTVKGPHGTEKVSAGDPEQLKRIRAGDQVVIVRTDTVAISVTSGTNP